MQLGCAQRLLIWGCAAHCGTAACADEILNPSNWRSKLIGSTESIIVPAIASRHDLKRGIAADRADEVVSLRISTSQKVQSEGFAAFALDHWFH
jgi:hypothetical protein